MSSNSYRFIIIFFLSLTLLGTFLLSVPWSVNSDISFIDRLFTATSAVCVTGLSVVDISKKFSLLGQIIILCLIQIGALGYMILGTVSIILFGRLSVIQKNVIGESLNVKEFGKISQITNLMRKVLGLTLIFEFIGVLILTIKFYFFEEMSIIKSVWFALFHSVSAFCNAGFSLFPNSFESYRGDILINITLAFLIISGGLGFFVWLDIFDKIRKKRENLFLHSKVVLFTTVMLILLGIIFIYLLNIKVYSIKGLSLKEKILISFFHSITPRTAGFNTFPMTEFSIAGIIFIVIFMFIGASPGSTGGGIKTTTFFVILKSIYDYLRGERYVSCFKRSIEITVILKSFTISYICLGWVFFVSLLIYLKGLFPFKEVLFETVSAFGTVGLSLGITQNLDNYSKILLIITMLFGRVGSLAFLSILFVREPKEIKYLEEPLSVG
ncbi:MAG: TrkH family potassium uptake protein [Endomicrobia bacterium]|nr:TrkH family potassium uptake protein [Endomicrobiia bacterium]